MSGQHEEILLLRQDGRLERIDTVALGLPLGMDADLTRFFAETTLALHPGDALILYTDGVTEAWNANQEPYGLERLCTVLRQNGRGSAQAIQQAVIADVQCHIGGQKVFDDLTLLVIKQQ